MTALRRFIRPVFIGSLAIGAASTLAGCGALVVGGAAAGTAMVATDRRTAGEQVEDQAIEMKIGSEVRRQFASQADQIRVTASSYAGRVLLVGDVPSQSIKDSVGKIAQSTEKVVHVDNELRVGDYTPLSVRSNDTWLSTKVRTNLINAQDVPSRTIVVTTERGVVYLQGKVTATEGDKAAKVASEVGGINKVVKLFEIVSRESVLNPQSPAPVESKNAAPAADSGGASQGGAVETIPIK